MIYADANCREGNNFSINNKFAIVRTLTVTLKPHHSPHKEALKYIHWFSDEHTKYDLNENNMTQFLYSKKVIHTCAALPAQFLIILKGMWNCEIIIIIMPTHKVLIIKIFLVELNYAVNI